MTTAFIADATVINGTAGTSVTVSKPTGTLSGHVLVAYIATVGAAFITPPDDSWRVIGTRVAGTLVRISGFWKISDGDPADWTWTLGASQRNWGWVGAYSGVDLIEPAYDADGETSSTAGTAYAFTAGNAVSLPDEGVGVSAVAAVRTASGAATTWTGSGTEQADLSTNAGSGTDIAGQAQHTIYTAGGVVSYQPSWTASQAQTAAAMLAVTLRPAQVFTGYDGGLLATVVEAAFGADPDGDPAGWVWTDISADVFDKVSMSAGRDDRGGIDEELTSTKITFTLMDTTGKYVPDNPNGANYPNVVERVPVRVRVPFGYTPLTTLATAFVDRWSPSWTDTNTLAFVEVSATGRLQYLRDQAQPVHSVLRRTIEGATVGVTPHAYWPCEDGSGSTRVASALPGHQPLQSSLASFASLSDLGGSAALPSLPENGVIGGALGPGQTATGQWCLVFAARLPETPVPVESRIVAVRCTGTALDWSLWMVPGSPDTFNIRAHAYGGTLLLDDPVAIVENDHYGKWRLYSLGVTQNGANVDYEGHSFGAATGVGNSGTLAGRTIGTARSARFVAFSAFAGLGVGHVALYTDPTFDPALDPQTIAFAALDGNAGDHAITRFRSLCAQLDVPFETFGSATESTDIGMGSQPPGRIGDLLQSAADTDHGYAHDADPSGTLILRARDSTYNQDPILVLDNNLHQVPVDLRPTTDGQGRISDSTVSRDGGSSARYVNTNTLGGKPDAKTLSLETDQHLYEIAGWRVALGQQGRLRYTQVPLNLRKSPELTERWLRSSIGSRVQLINLSALHGPQEADGILVGWRQEAAADRWMVYMNLATARPHDVPVMESGDTKSWRLETGGSELAAAATSSATSLLVATTGDIPWTTDPAQFPQDLDVNGERVTASAVADSVTDAFGRTVANGWGTADTGQTWTTANGAAGDYAVSGGTGRITSGSTGVLRAVLLDVGSTDVEYTVDLVFPNAAAATSAYSRWVCGRLTDTSNHYGALLQLETTGLLTLAAFKRVTGTFTNLGSKSAGANGAGNTWRATITIVGSVLKVTARNLTAGTPPVAVRVTNLNDPTLTGTNIAVIDRREVGNTDAGIVGQWDNLGVTNPQTFTVTRGVSGGATAKAHSAGAPVRLWRARGVAL